MDKAELKPSDESIYKRLERVGYRWIKKDGKLWSPDDMAEELNALSAPRVEEPFEPGGNDTNHERHQPQPSEVENELYRIALKVTSEHKLGERINTYKVLEKFIEILLSQGWRKGRV